MADPDTGSAAPASPDPWAEASDAVVHLPLDAFPALPEWARRRLEAHGCSVPQGFHSERPHNVMAGELAAPGQRDWAALCSRGDTTEIVVAWGGPAGCPTPHAGAHRMDHLQGIGQGRIGYSRAIGEAPMERIRALARAFDGPAPPAGEHSGINDAFVEKASTIHYCHDGQWHRLAGMD